MKKRSIEIIVLCTVLAAAAVFAIAGRMTHTDNYGALIDKVEDGGSGGSGGEDINANVTYYVAELPESIIESAVGRFEKLFPQSPYIIRCEILEPHEPSYNAMRVKVRVNKVYEGEGLNEGDEIYIVKESWGCWTEEDDSQDDKDKAAEKRMYLDIGFHNLMKTGEEYLVFLCEHMELNEEKYGDVYRIEDFSFPPYFLCEEDRENVIIPVDEDNTYVKYSDVYDNEFFCTTEKGLELVQGLKKKMLEMYN